MDGFWGQLKGEGRPILAMAPMAGITDSPFRRLCRRFGADVLYSEMASVSALVRGEKAKTLRMLRFDESERPYVVQLFGSEPAEFRQAARIITEEIGPDGIDINFGCPVPKVCRSGAGSALFRDPDRSRQVIEAALAGSPLPVSIKTRTKAGESELLPFLDLIRDLPVAALMVHGRSFCQGFSGGIDCAVIKKARDHFGGVILANGGVNSPEIARRILSKSGADGLGIGRGALGRPWIFSEIRDPRSKIMAQKDICRIIIEHAGMMKDFYGEEAGIREMRKHLGWYVRGFAGAAVLRQKLMRVEKLEDIGEVFGLDLETGEE